MRIAEMIAREDFFTILENTLNTYFRLVRNADDAFSYEEGPGEKLIINAKLGFISRFPAPRGLLTFLNGEYNIRGNFAKYLAGHAAATLIWAFPQLGQTRTCRIAKGLLGKNAFIYPQNRSVRIFDYESGQVDCIVKSGFSDKYFNNQLQFRLAHRYDFMVPLSAHGDIWFREPILDGHPLARTKNGKAYQKGLDDAVRGIRRLAEDTRSEVCASEYAQALLADIEPKLRRAAGEKQIQYSEPLLHTAQAAAEILSRSDTVELCLGHGDFQSGNIWVDPSGKTYIYDWETVGRRSVWYDSAVLNYSLRRAYGWKSLLDCAAPEAMRACEQSKRVAPDYAAMKSAVWLEDILFYLDDLLELPGTSGREIFDAFAGRMVKLWNGEA